MLFKHRITVLVLKLARNFTEMTEKTLIGI